MRVPRTCRTETLFDAALRSFKAHRCPVTAAQGSRLARMDDDAFFAYSGFVRDALRPRPAGALQGDLVAAKPKFYANLGSPADRAIVGEKIGGFLKSGKAACGNA